MPPTYALIISTLAFTINTIIAYKTTLWYYKHPKRATQKPKLINQIHKNEKKPK